MKINKIVHIISKDTGLNHIIHLYELKTHGFLHPLDVKNVITTFTGYIIDSKTLEIGEELSFDYNVYHIDKGLMAKDERIICTNHYEPVEILESTPVLTLWDTIKNRFKNC